MDSSTKFCLDIAEMAVTQGCSCLSLRKVDSRRVTTQIWTFQDGRLCCGINGQCVQAVPAFGGTLAGARVALGPMSPDITAESRVESVKMLPGSGVLSVMVSADGPTRVLKIADLHELDKIKETRLAGVQSVTSPATDKHSLKVHVNLPRGIGLSVVNRTPEELAYLILHRLEARLNQAAGIQKLELSVRHIQLDNHVFGAAVPVIIFSMEKDATRKLKDKERPKAFQLSWQRCLTAQTSMHVFNSFQANLSDFSLNLEETLLWMLVEMFTSGEGKKELESVQQKPTEADYDVTVRKYYFGLLQVICGQVSDLKSCEAVFALLPCTFNEQLVITN